ncbi:MAG: hypothetical protein GF346_12195, partial [Candidatus Eisenbacteria bacterium]|nr:hypothetical protein [Candidatus Latescibacterota bacterium]MBD3303197.1 hypothetical protein [Candidatus Eisenbacteria bacterium]
MKGSVLRGILVLYLFLLLFPGEYVPLATGLDPSWRIGINLLAGSGHSVGDDYVFTYGPLGYLLYPLPLGNNLAASIFFDLILALLVCFLGYLVLRRCSALEALLFVSFYAASIAIHLWEEYNLLFLAALLLAATETESRHERLLLIGYGVLASFALFLKISIGLTCLLMLVGFALGSGQRNRFVRRIAFAGLSFGVSFAVLSLVFLESASGLLWWLKGSVLLSRGYGSAMSVIGPSEVLVLGLIALGVFTRALERLARTRLDLAVALGIAAVLAFKHGFARQDRHVLGFFPFLIALSALLVPFSISRKGRAATILAFLVLFIAALPTVRYYTHIGPRQVLATLSTASGLERVGSLLRLPEKRRELEQRSERRLTSDLLPDGYLQTLRGGGGVA